MRVLVLSSRTPDVAASSIAAALADVHEVDEFDYSRGLQVFRGRLRPLNRIWQGGLRANGRSVTYFADRALLRFARQRVYDLVVILQVNLVPGEVVEELARATGALVVGWFMDAIVNLDEVPFLLAPYERVFLKDKVVVTRFQKALASNTVDFLPQAFDPALHRPVNIAPDEETVDVATYGNSYLFRYVVMRSLLEADEITTVIHGTLSGVPPDPLVRVYRPPVRGLEKSRAMRRARVALNTTHYAELGGVNKRTFELAGMGAFQLTDGPAVADYFAPGEEVATYEGPRDLLEKVRYYLARPAERREIAERGLRRAWSEHSYHQRLNEMFDSVPALRGERKLEVPVLDSDPPKGTIEPSHC